MSEKNSLTFEQYLETLTDDEKHLSAEFFADFKTRCSLIKGERHKMRDDFRRAILYYHSQNIPLKEALEYLALENLGGFYAHPPTLWYPLDDAAKIYPLSMDHGRMTLFRLSVYFKKDIVPELLQMALNFTIKRFPSFATTLKKGFFWHYLDTSKRRYCIEKEQNIPCRPISVSLSGSQTFRVLYYKNRLSVEFFHVLTDGSGGLTFLRVLAAEYLRLTGVKAENDGTLLNINDSPSPEEISNEFPRVERSESGGFLDKPATQMSGILSKTKPCRVIHFKMDTDSLKAAAAKHNTSVTSLMLSIMFLAGKSATEELHGELSIQVPVNMRKFYPSETVRNFSMYCTVRIPIEKIRNFADLTAEISRQLTEKGTKENMDKMANSAENLVHMLAYIPLAIKQPIAKRVYGFLSDTVFSNTLSNLGVVEMPAGYAEHIESMDFVLGPLITNRTACAMITFGNTSTFSVTKSTTDPTFEEVMYRYLLEEGIITEVEGSELYEN